MVDREALCKGAQEEDSEFFLEGEVVVVVHMGAGKVMGEMGRGMGMEKDRYDGDVDGVVGALEKGKYDANVDDVEKGLAWGGVPHKLTLA